MKAYNGIFRNDKRSNDVLLLPKEENQSKKTQKSSVSSGFFSFPSLIFSSANNKGVAH